MTLRADLPWRQHLPRAGRLVRWTLASAALATGLVAGAHRESPWADVTISSTAQPVLFVESPTTTAPDPAAVGPEGAGDATTAVWFLTVSERRLSPLEHVLGRDRPRVVTASGVSPFRADDDFRRSQRAAREVAGRLDPLGRVVVEPGVANAPGLRAGDQLVAVDGEEIEGPLHAAELIARWKVASGPCRRCADPLVLTVVRDGEPLRVDLYVDRSERAGVDIPLDRVSSVPLPSVGDVKGGEFHGASAGLAFALGYLDRLSDRRLLGGRSVAATGALVDDRGGVGVVSQVEEKLAAAIAAGVDVVFVPEANAGDVPPGLPVTVVTVDHVVDAVRWLCADGGCGDFAPGLR